MLRFTRLKALAFVMIISLLALGELVAGRSTDEGAAPQGAPHLEAVLDGAVQVLDLSGTGTPGQAYILTTQFAINGGAWQMISSSGSFNAQGGMDAIIPLSVFQFYNHVDVVLHLSVTAPAGQNSGYLHSMAWAMTMRRLSSTTLHPLVPPSWRQVQIALPGTTSPTFPVSSGSVAITSGQSQRTTHFAVFLAGPALLVQALATTGIEGMLPVN